MAWLFRPTHHNGYGFSASSTSEEVTHGIDASNLTAIVTGANSGIGSETVRVLALRGAEVVMAVRSLSSGLAVKNEIVKEIENARLHVLQLDLSSLSSVRNFVNEFKSLNLPLNILINNAGIMACPYQLSPDGIEIQFATNHIGHFLLTKLLLDDMKRTAKETGIEGRIVNVSSIGHKFTYSGGIRIDKLNDESGYSAWLAYGQSKLANILHAVELTHRLQEEGVNITANALHPGAIVTNLQRHHAYMYKLVAFVKSITKTVSQGASTQCFLALHPAVKGVSGKYFSNCCESDPSGYVKDEKLRKTLWEVSEKITSEQ